MEKNIEVIQKAVKWAYDIANDPKHGYDQILRWGNDYDCSSFVISAYENAGVPLRKNGATYTGNMRDVMLKCGFEDVTRIVNFARGSGLLYGDVLLNVKHHTAIYAGNGFEIEASINENRRTIGGLTGDQTGKEILVRNYRDYPWNYCLRFVGVGVKKRVTKKVISDVIAGRYGNGAIRERNLTAEGFDYMEVQKRVNEALRGELKMYLQDFLKTEEGTKVSKLNKASCTYGFFYNYWRDMLFERIIRLFVWSGVEESGIPVKEIETRLHLRGFCAITKGVKGSKPDNLTAVFADFFGVTKYYDEWENITYHCPIDSGQRKINKDCVIINNNALRNPTFMLVHHYATLLGHVEVTLINALINVRDAGGVPVVTGEKQKQAAMHYLGKIFNGEYDCIADPSMMGVEYVGADRHTMQSIIDIYQTRERILKSFYNDIGVRTAVEKRANVVTPEITANDGLLQLNISDMLKERQEGAERVNRLYGTNWTVKIADEIQYGEENEQNDNAESNVSVSEDTETD